MATLKETVNSFRIYVATGTSDSGKTIFADRLISSKVNPALSDADFLAVAEPMANLQSNVISNVSREVVKKWELD